MNSDMMMLWYFVQRRTRKASEKWIAASSSKDVFMRRATGLLTTLGLLSISSLALAQADPLSPALPSQVLGPQLIVWSQLQKPQPVPQPLPAALQQNKQSAKPPGRQQPDARTSRGSVVKDLGNHQSKPSSDH
jgi:hypothetical protein